MHTNGIHNICSRISKVINDRLIYKHNSIALFSLLTGVEQGVEKTRMAAGLAVSGVMKSGEMLPVDVRLSSTKALGVGTQLLSS
jgi:hypothetical protein